MYNEHNATPNKLCLLVLISIFLQLSVILCVDSLCLYLYCDLHDPAVVEIANKGIKVMANIVPITQQI